MTLDAAAVGSHVRVVRVQGEDALARRLSSLGLRSGARVLVMRRAVWGDPTEYKLHGYRLGLRRDEAVRVIVAAEDGADGD